MQALNTLLILVLIGNFHLPVEVSAYKEPQCAPGRHVMVHLFEWRWGDIAAECVRYLGPNKFCGVQVSPPNEHRIFISTDPKAPVFRPWWERYQPVSYRLDSRSGSEAEFAEMVATCNAQGVRIYVDAVVNHMAMVGAVGRGSGGSYYDAGREDFPGVPFAPRHFNGPNECPTKSLQIENYTIAVQVRNCRLVNLVDLRTGTNYVQAAIAGYFNRLLTLGVAGFRIDAAKHMWPEDIRGILGRTNNLLESVFGRNQRPFVYQEVIDLKGNGEPIKNAEYTPLARVTEFNYGREVGRAFSGSAPLSSLRNFRPGHPDAYLVPSGDALVFLDNHDNQRGHGGGSQNILTFRRRNLYEAATAFEMIGDYGFVRIMSSYHWVENIVDGKDLNDWHGPPSSADGTTNPVRINPINGQCEGDWVCEHRWPSFRRLVQLRAAVQTAPAPAWSDVGGASHSIAVGRPGVAFYVAATAPTTGFVQTGLPAGLYCDILSGEKNSTNTGCTGQTVTVAADGRADVSLPLPSGQIALAIYTGSYLP